MAKKKRTTRRSKKKKQRLQLHPRLMLGLSLAIVLIVLLAIWSMRSRQVEQTKKLDLAEKKLEMTKLPADIKKNLQNQNTASVSAALHIPILMYHYVEYVKDKGDTIRQSLDILPPVFQAQIETLKNADYTFLTMRDVADIMSGKMILPKNPIVITFDDGYRDLYTDVFPIIKKEHIKIVAYIVPGFLDKPNFLLTSQFLEIAQSNYVEIAAHTMHHLYLKKSSEAVDTREILESKIVLEKLIGRPVVSFAYPYGAFDQQAMDVVKNAGFATAVSTLPGKEESDADRFFMYRLRPGGRTGEVLLHFLQQTGY